MPTAKILLVEDELPLLQLLEKHLRRLGFEVDAHSTSASSLRALESASAAHDLAVMDLGLPDMRGDELLTKMLEIKPDLQVLVCSGSPFFIGGLPAALQPRVAFLQKPFVPKELAATIERMLAQRGKSANS